MHSPIPARNVPELDDGRTTPDEISVLYVDDEPDLLELSTERLEAERDVLTVTPVASASAALDRLAAETVRFDCIVSDLQMPGQDGLDLLEAVREEHPDLPFLLHTSMETERSVRDALRAGATDYLHKRSGAAHYALLATRIENAVARYRAERTVEKLQRRLAQVIETPPGVVVLLDADGQCQYVGPAVETLLGYSPDTLRGEALFEYIHPDDRARAIALFSTLIGDPDSHSAVDVRVEQSDGSWRRVTCWGWNHLDEDHLGGVGLYIQDESSDGTGPDQRVRSTAGPRHETTTN